MIGWIRRDKGPPGLHARPGTQLANLLHYLKVFRPQFRPQLIEIVEWFLRRKQLLKKVFRFRVNGNTKFFETRHAGSRNHGIVDAPDAIHQANLNGT